MTRILRFLLIAAVAWPLCQPIAAQDAAKGECLMLPKPSIPEDVPAARVIKKADSPKQDASISKNDVGVKSHTESFDETVCDGTATNQYLPIYSYFYDNDGGQQTRSQMIYPEDILKDILKEGDQIQSLTFYAPSGITFGNAAGTSGVLTIKLGKSSVSSFSSNAFTSFDGTAVSATVTPKKNDTEFTVTFSNAFTYTGGDLLVDVTVTTAGTANSSTSNHTYFGGETTTNAQSRYYYYSSRYGAQSSTVSFLPKMTISYTREMPDPYEATLDGNGAFGKVVVDQTGRATFTVTNTGTNAFTPVVTLSGDQQFSVRTNGYGKLDPGVSRYYLVTFAPTELGDCSATLTLTAKENEAAAINLSASLTGTGSETKEQAVGEGNETNTLPVYLWYLETANHGQMIYQASDLNLTKGTKIKSITFHANNTLTGNNNGSSKPVTLLIGETTQSSYSSTSFIQASNFTNGSQSSTVQNIFTGENYVTFTFGTPYEYQGGNIVLDASCTNGGAYVSGSGTMWRGDNKDSYVGLLARSSSSSSSSLGTPSQLQFLPMITIDCVPGLIQGRDNELVVTDPDEWKNFTYDWYENGNTANLKHTSSLDSIATNPDQIIAMLRKVYMDPQIPGNKKRGFTEAALDDHDNYVNYTGVGTIKRSGTGQSGASFDDTFGWNIPSTKSLIYNTYEQDDSHTWEVWKMDPTEYEPEHEGVTLLLLELRDDFDPEKISVTATSGYAQLREYFYKTIKSARVITEAKRTGTGLESGTLFKIDCDKMNMFYLIAKGQLAWMPSMRHTWASVDFEIDPCYNYVSNYNNVDGYLDPGVDPSYSVYFFLGHMFEQFSPSISQNAGEQTGAKDDIYQDLINMQSFGVVHDCPNVPLIGHHFMMYGQNDEVADCQDVRDMMFFIPDYRMLDWAERGIIGTDGRQYQDYFCYNATIQPVMGLYVIRQNEITPTTEADEYYMLNLNWVTNLDEFLPSDQQEFELFEVVVDEATGKESYVPVYYINENGEYTDAEGTVVGEENKVPIVLTMNPGKEKNYPNVYVKREDASKEVTYVIRGRDVTIENGERKHFLSLQYSNKMSYIVPGTDPSELVLLKDATHYSRFDAERVRNAYSNKLVMSNNVDGMKQANLTSGSKMTITRVAQVQTGSTAGVTTDPVTVATVTFNPSDMTYTVQMAGQADDEEEFPLCSDEESRAGYHANNDGTVKGDGSWTGEYTVTDDGYINLGRLSIFDNFVQAIPDDNSHPFGYIYNVTTNYPCPPTAVYLRVSSTVAAENPLWYAWTWDDNVEGKWVTGTLLENGDYKFTKIYKKLKFVRMNPAVEGNDPSWDYKWNETNELWTTDYMGKTFILEDNWSMNGSWSETTTDEMAHGNTFRIPIYKTSSQINGIFSKGDVDGDLAGIVGKIGNADLPENVEFGVGVSLNSKTEVLRYDTYRWPEGDARYTVQTADGDDEQDIAPSGQAMNQGESYTITMNGDTEYETNDEVSVSGGSATATFVDKYPGLESNEAEAYIYAPIVETFTNRGDYNTYGGPLQSSASGRFDAQRDPGYNPMSSYYWEDGGKRYAYYTIQFSVDRTIKMVPDGYDIYKIRVWRKIDDKSLLKEEYANQSTAIAARMGDSNGTYMYEITYDEEDGQVMHNFKNGASLGSIEMKALTDTVIGANGSENMITYSLGTFGAQKLRTNETEAADLAKVIEQLDLTYVVRLYFTRSANLTAAKGAAEGADGKYYIVEQEIPVTLQGGIPTAVENINASQVASVKYYNVAGIESDTPFDGVNIVVTRYSDGSTTTTKILK